MNDTFADVLAINQSIVRSSYYFISDLMFTQYKKQHIHGICFEVYCEIEPF